MTAIGWIIVGFFWAGMGICGTWSALLEMEARGEVNKLRPSDKPFPIPFGNFPHFPVRREYRRLFPDGQLCRRADRLTALMTVTFLGMVLAIYFFAK
jgi:hypothetical protein